MARASVSRTGCPEEVRHASDRKFLWVGSVRVTLEKMQADPDGDGTMIRLDTPLARTALAAVVLALLPVPSEAQVLQGRVLDGSSRQPLSDARITLLYPDGRALADPVTSSGDGSFILRLPGEGEYFIRVERPSHTPIVDGIFEFTGLDGRMTIEVFMLPRPVELEGIDVQVQRERERRKLRRSGFYDRAAMGFGDFVTPSEIEQVGPTMNVSDFMLGIPGINFYGGLVLFKTDSPSGGLTGPDGTATFMCEPAVWIDGVRMTPAVDLNTSQIKQTDFAQGIDDYVNPQDVLAMEVFRRASSTPLQWGGIGSTCGTIVIWTKAGTG